MKKNPGRKQRRRLARQNRREEGRTKSILNEMDQGGHDARSKLRRNLSAQKAWGARKLETIKAQS